MKKTLFIIAIFSLFVSCKQKEKPISKTENTKTEKMEDFPKEKDISEFKNTDFVVALEKDFPKNKNVVYAPTILFAWDEVRKIFNSQNFTSETENQDFNLLNSSRTFENSLNDYEYDISVNTETKVEVVANFKKSLPFEMNFEKIDSINFKNNSVKGFGIGVFNKDLLKQIYIAYYKNDNDFAVKLLPSSKEDEIILLKSDKKFNNFSDVYTDYIDKENFGKSNLKNPKTSWKNEFSNEDELKIPNLGFNSGKFFSEFTNFSFTDENGNLHLINSLFQRNAFVLNEKGAKAESEVVVALDAYKTAIIDEDTPRPKNLFFNNDFYIFLKKANSKNPYFAIKIVDAELMIKN